MIKDKKQEKEKSFKQIWKDIGKINAENRGNSNIKFDTKRIAKNVLEIIEVCYNLNNFEKQLVCESVLTTIWELFERKEEHLKECLKGKEEYKWEFGE